MMLDCMIIFALVLCLYITDHLPSISLDDRELVIEGEIEHDEYITNAMEAIEKYYNISKY